MVLVSLATSQNRWMYPFQPGTEAWKKMSLQERREAQQIPAEILKNMPTEMVFQAWQDLPGRLEILAFNSIQQGFDFTVKTYNVLQELLAREDIGQVVLNHYLKMKVDNLNQKTSDKAKGEFITDFGFIEFLLSQPLVLNSLSENDKKRLIKETIKRLEDKASLPQDLKRDAFWEESGLILSARILRNLKNQKLLQVIEENKMLKESLDIGEIRSESVYNEIYNNVMDYYNNNHLK